MYFAKTREWRLQGAVIVIAIDSLCGAFQMKAVQIDKRGEDSLRVLFIDPYGAFLTWETELEASGCHWDLDRVEDADVGLARLKDHSYDAVLEVAAIRR